MICFLFSLMISFIFGLLIFFPVIFAGLSHIIPLAIISTVETYIEITFVLAAILEFLNDKELKILEIILTIAVIIFSVLTFKKVYGFFDNIVKQITAMI